MGIRYKRHIKKGKSVSKVMEFVVKNRKEQGRIKTKLGLMLLTGKGPNFFSALKTKQEVQDPWLAMQPP